jgi:hypothetical protein
MLLRGVNNTAHILLRCNGRHRDALTLNQGFDDQGSSRSYISGEQQ